MSPRILFTTLAIAEAFTWVLLLSGMFLKYVTRTTEVLVSIGGAIHGFVFLAYCAVALVIAISQRWRIGVLLGSLVAAVIPLATVPFEMWARRRGHLDGAWQLAPGGREFRGLPDRAVALLLRRPIVSGLVLLVVVSLVFAGLLVVGPPGGGDH